MIELLKGIKVLDLTRLLPGPLCTMYLADMGAEVIKVEDTKAGDYTRWDPPKVKVNSAFFLLINRNKKSMRLNLKSERGLEVFNRLAGEADVVIEQFRPGVAAKLGVGYQAVKEINPSVVYCSLTGYGQDGPYRDKAGHDLNYLGYAGLLSQSGRCDGPPVVSALQVADEAGGSLMAAMGILSALLYKQRTGAGQYIDVAMLDGSLSLMPIVMGTFYGSGQVPGRGDSLLNGGTPCYDIYETKDGGFMALGALESKFWGNFCRAVGRDDLFERQFPEGEEKQEVRAQVRAIFKRKSRAQWEEFFSDVDACCTPVLELDEVEGNEQIQAREMVFDLNHPHEGSIKQLGFPLKFSGFDFEVQTPPPMWGEHTEGLLEGLGYSIGDITELKEQGVV